jgi:hypothetical protein
MRHIRKVLAVTAAGAAIAFAAPASAAVVVNSDDAIGTQYSVDFVGQVGGNVETGLSALLTLTFTGIANGGATYNFDYDLLNDSALSARLSGFGFNNSNITGGTVDGTYTIVAGGNLPGFGGLDICFKDGGGTSNCGGGGGGGVFSGNTASGTLSLNFGSALDSIALDDFTTRFQDIQGSNYGNSGIGLGTSVPAVPEPSTWALMLLGFGALGWGMRRRNAADGQPRMRVVYN